MNRIRKINNVYQVLITPNIKVSPDSSLMLGNWEDEELRNFFILEFDTLRAAQCEAFKHPDIDWYRIILNHKNIFYRLELLLEHIIHETGFTVEFHPTLMDPEQFKNTIFDRVMKSGERFNLRYGLNDIMNFTIVNPWFSNLEKLSKKIEAYRDHLYRNDVRIRSKKILDKKIIFLYGSTELGTVFQIKLTPTLLYQYSEWLKKKGQVDEDNFNGIYRKILESQDYLDNSIVLR